MNDLNELFQMYEHSSFRCEHRGQERRMDLTELNHILNTFPTSGTLIASEWHLVSTWNLHCLAFHFISDMTGTAGLGQGF